MRPARYAGALIALIALVVLAGSVVLSLSVPLRSDVQFWVLAASFGPWAIFGYLLALVVLLLLRRRASGLSRRLVTVAAVLSLLGVGLHAAWLAPSYVGEHAGGDPDLTVLGFNMHFGGADIAATKRLVERADPDVIVLSEATPSAVQALAANGIGGPESRWPHQGGTPLWSVEGTVALSAYPLSGERRLDIATGTHRMRVEAPTPFWLTAVHTTQPLNSNALWRHDFGLLVADTREVTGPHIVMGDFNATLDHGRMRELLDAGLHDAAVEANSGWQPTWPKPGYRKIVGVPLPVRLMAIDRVLLSEEFSAISTSVHSVPDTDHDALVARLVVG